MQKFYKLILKIAGWKVMEPPVPEPKCIILGVPHTSVWDFIVSLLYYNSEGHKAYIMIKDSFFRWPFGKILRAVGGIPVKQGKGANLSYRLLKSSRTEMSFTLLLLRKGQEALQTGGKPDFIQSQKLQMFRCTWDTLTGKKERWAEVKSLN